MRLETSRLIIRPYEQRDAQQWIAMVNDPEVCRYLPSGPKATAATFDSTLERRKNMERDLGYTMWAIELRERGGFIGQCGLQPVERTGPEIELAYHFQPAAWGRGYATEAAIAVLGHGFDAANLKRVIALVMPANLASCRVVEKAGMHFEGTSRYYGIPDLRTYVALNESWKPPLN